MTSAEQATTMTLIEHVQRIKELELRMNKAAKLFKELKNTFDFNLDLIQQEVSDLLSYINQLEERILELEKRC